MKHGQFWAAHEQDSHSNEPTQGYIQLPVSRYWKGWMTRGLYHTMTIKTILCEQIGLSAISPMKRDRRLNPMTVLKCDECLI